MRYYIESGGRTLGPFELATAREMLNKGTISPDTRISTDMVSWKRAAEYGELSESNAPPTPPPLRQTAPTPPAPPVPLARETSEPSEPPVPAPPPLSKEFYPPKESKVRVSKKPKGERSQKMSTQLFWSWLTLSIGLLLGFVALLILAVFYQRLSPALAVLIQGIGLVGSVFLFCADIFALMLLHAFWTAIPADLRRVSPDVAVGFLFVPLWQFYWIFVALVSGAESMNAALDQRGLLRQRTSGVPTGLAAGAALCLIVVPLQLVGIILFYSLAVKMQKAVEHLEAAQNQ